jgi:transposase-like protein
VNRKPDKNLRGFKRTQYLAEDERCRLLYGPYEPPLVKGGFLVDAFRGKVRFSHFTNARIPWPKCKKTKSKSGGGSGGFVLCGDLVRALTDESASAVAFHWGVSHGTITNWRRALELRGLNAGSHRLMEIGVELARRPESRAKNSASKQGKVLSRTHKIHLFAAMKAGWKERFEARRNAYRRTGRFPQATKSDPWIPEEEKLLAKHSTTDLVRIIRRTTKGIQARRIALGIRSLPSPTRQPWRESETKILGTDTDRVIAKRLERSVFSVTKKRQALGIRGLSPTH